VIRLGDSELLVEERVELEVVMLAGVDGDDGPAAAEGVEEDGGLDDLGSGAVAEGEGRGRDCGPR
jgi:hypothetical protein